MAMFFEDTYTDNANSTGTIGDGWYLDGSNLSVASGLMGPTTTASVNARRTTPAVVANEVYAEVRVTAVNSTTDIGVIIATGSSDTNLETAYFYARYLHSNGRYQMFHKAAGSTTNVSIMSSVTASMTPPKTIGLELHGDVAKMFVDGVQVGTDVNIAAYAETYKYPGVRFRASAATRVDYFRTGDYGVTSGASGPVLSGFEMLQWNGTALVPLEYLGLWDGTSAITSVGLEFMSI